MVQVFGRLSDHALKVLHIYRTYYPDPPGGLQEAIRQISLATSALGVEVKILTLSPTPYPSEIQRPEATVVREKSFWAPASCDLGGMGAFRRYSELTSWADIIHFHFPWPFADVLNLAITARKPKITTYHSDVIRQKLLGFFYAPLMHKSLGMMNAIVATSAMYAKTSKIINHPVLQGRLHVIPLGIEDRMKSTSHDDDTTRQHLARWNIQDDSYILSLGVLRYYKGLHYLLEAAKSIQGKVVIAGSGPEEKKLQALAVQLKTKNVFFIGRVTDEEKHALLKHCRALALPSHLRSEAFGMVLVEASMYGKPMVCCEVESGTSFINIHEKTGLVVRPGNPAELAKAINFLLTNEKVAKTMGCAARERYEQHFSSRALGRSYAHLYNHILSDVTDRLKPNDRVYLGVDISPKISP
jgi:rhamnosyl/mannosyltransferase